jgi:hypothetical protein
MKRNKKWPMRSGNKTRINDGVVKREEKKMG